jgi:hypothetical protein
MPTSLLGTINTASLNVRQGPGTEYGIIGAAYRGNRILILGRTSDATWLQVEILASKIGWVATRLIDLPIAVATIPIVVVSTPDLPPPPPPTARPTPAEPSTLFGQIKPGQTREYVFSDGHQDRIFVLMFKPNINWNNIDYVQFDLYHQDPAGQPIIVGVGSYPGSDRDGDLNTGELVWRGGALTPGVEYHLRFTNNGPEAVQYCLAIKDVYEWRCPS